MITMISLAPKTFLSLANRIRQIFRDDQDRTNNMMQPVHRQAAKQPSSQAAKPGSTLASLNTGLRRNQRIGRSRFLPFFSPDLFASPPLCASQAGLSTKVLKRNTARRVMPSVERP
jgi:hypothetical protein